MIELKKADFAKEGKKIKALYIRAFPREERPPFFLIRKRAEQGRAECWSLYDGKAWAGFAYVLREGGLAYLFLLAIDEAKRGQGLGTQTIGALLRQYDGCRFFLALEKMDPSSPNYEQRQKRHDFYIHCGLKDLPFHLKEAAVVYDAMGSGAQVLPEEYRRMMRAWLGWPFRRLIDVKMLKK